MGLKENLDAGEKAVAEVKKHVQYASNNLRADRLAALLKASEQWEATVGVRQKEKAELRQEAATAKRMVASVKTKVAFFEKAATLPPQPTKLPVGNKLDVMRAPSPLDKRLGAIRDQRDPNTGHVLVEGETTKKFKELVAGGAPRDMHTNLIAAAWVAKQNKIGNCGEQAAIAFLYLEGITAAPLDYMQFDNDAMGYDHAWIVIGRIAGSDPHKVATWGSDAVWCDPWQLREGRVYSIDDLIKKKATNLDASFKLNTAELVNAGLPSVVYRRP